MSTSEFSKYLQEETTFKPRRGDNFTRDGIKNRDSEVKFETTRAKTKRTLNPKIEEEIYQKYLKAVKEGKREGTIIGLGREYLPGLTRGQQEKTVSRILKEKGVDLSPFKKIGTGKKAATQVARKKKLGAAKKQAGSSAGQLSDEIILDIKAMNKKVADMPVEDIVKNKKYINSMRINATMDNLSKGVIPFDKYKDLSDLELANKIKDRAKLNKFFDVEHISSVKGQKRNIYYPNNIQMAPGQFGSLMDNFKRIADEQPNNAVLSKVDKILSDYGLTVRNPKNNVRLGNKNVIEVKNGMSNIVQENFNSIGTPFEKQTITKVTPMRGSSKEMKSIANGLSKILECKLEKGVNCDDPMSYYKSLKEQEEIAAKGKGPNKIKAINKVKAAKNFIYGTLGPYALALEAAIAAPIAGYQASKGALPSEILNTATYGLAGKDRDELIQEQSGKEIFKARNFLDTGEKLDALRKDPIYGGYRGKADRIGALEDTSKKFRDQYQDSYFADPITGKFSPEIFGIRQQQQIDAEAKDQKGRDQRAKEFADKYTDTSSGLELFASGGLANLTRTIPPEKGPQSQGLAYFMKNGKR